MQSEVLELIHLVTRMASLSQEFFILTGWSSPEPESYLATTLLYLKVCKATRTGYVLSSNWNTIMPRRWFATTALAYSGPLPNLFQTRTTTPIYCSLSLGTTKTGKLGNAGFVSFCGGEMCLAQKHAETFKDCGCIYLQIASRSQCSDAASRVLSVQRSGTIRKVFFFYLSVLVGSVRWKTMDKESFLTGCMCATLRFSLTACYR